MASRRCGAHSAHTRLQELPMDQKLATRYVLHRIEATSRSACQEEYVMRHAENRSAKGRMLMISAYTRTARPLLQALWWSMLPAGAMATVACTDVTAGAQDDQTATQIDELGEATCATTAADATLTGRIPDLF